MRITTLLLAGIGISLGISAQQIETTPSPTEVFPTDRIGIQEAMADPNFSKKDYDSFIESIHLPGQQKMMGGGGDLIPSCNCYTPPDDTYIQINQNQFTPNALDGSVGPYPIGFPFCFFGDTKNQFWINTKGTLTFNGSNTTFVPEGFPSNAYSMIAGFWADIDIRGIGGVYYKITPTAVFVNFVEVGYYNLHTEKTNSFQIIMTDGTDPVIGVGNNLAFCYEDMQWAAGDWNGGTGGFGGTAAATVGANRGSGNDFFQVGRFLNNGAAYDGPFGNNDGINWLDDRSFILDACFAADNIPPIPGSTSACDTLFLCQGETVDIDAQFFAPEQGQEVSIEVDDSGVEGFTLLTTTEGVFASMTGTVTASSDNVGEYTLFITATDNGSPAQSTTISYVIVVTDEEIPELSVGGVLEFCGGGSTVLTASSGFDAYSWSTGCNTQDCEINNGGEVTVSAVLNNCVASTTVTVTATPYTILGLDNFSSPICSNDSTLVCVNSLEVDNYESFSWDVYQDFPGILYGDTSQSCIYASSGTYIVQGTTPAGCISERIFSIGATDASIPDDSFSGTYCDGLEAVNFCCGSIAASAGNFNMSFITNPINPNVGPWITGANVDVFLNGELVFEGIPTAEQVANSLGQITISIPGVSYGDFVEIIYNNPADSPLTTGLTVTNCVPFPSIPVPLNPEGGTIFSNFTNCNFTPAPGTWSVLDGPPGASFSVSNQFNTNFTPGDYGIYELQFFSNTCGIGYVYDIEFNEIPEINILDDSETICDETELLISAELVDLVGNAVSTWSPGNESGLELAVDEAGVYTITATNNCGSSSDDFELFVTPIPNAVLEDAAICDGNPSTLDPISADDPSYEYEWSNSLPSDPEVEVNQPGTYSVTVSNECGSSTASVELSEIPIPNPSLNDLDLCDQTGTILDPIANEDPSFTYAWTGVNSDEESVEVTESGTYSVEVSNECGTVTASASVSFNTTPVADLSDVTVCDGATVVLDPIENDDPAFNYSWNNGLPANPTANITETGNYSVTVSNDCGSSTAEAQVSFSTAPDASLADVFFCEGDNLVLDPVSEDDPTFIYSWNNGLPGDPEVNITEAGTYTVTVENECGSTSASSEVTTELIPDPVLVDAVFCLGQTGILDPIADDQDYFVYDWSDGLPGDAEVQVTETGVYSVTVSSLCGENTVSAIVEFAEAISFDLLDQSLCEDGEATLGVPPGIGTYVWSDGSTSNTLTVDEPGVYSVTVTNACGQSSTQSASVNLQTPPTVFISIDTLNVCAGIVEQMNQVFYGGDYDAIVWTIQGELFSNSANPTVVSEDVPAEFVNVGVPLEVEVIGACGTAFDEVIIEPVVCSLWGYNVISPNDDGLNDLFIIGGSYFFDRVSVKVFNRWGSLVFSDDNYQNDWDAKDLETGTYFYTVETPEGIDLSGSFTLVR